MSDAPVVIRVENVSKTFKLPHEKNNSVKSAFINLKNKRKGYEEQKALNDVSFEVREGEFFGIVGRNGSGKSTLLKMLAGIYTPSKGRIEVAGKLTPFIELGVGFNPELTGRENIFLNGALLGFSRNDMAEMYDEIVKFAELDRFMDQKLKNYSSGMQVRLAFSIAIRAKSDILLIDEVLAVGDLDFQKKCYKYFFDLKNKNQTVILVTHDMSAVRTFCDRGALINQGHLVATGSADQIASQYESINLQSVEERLNIQNQAPIITKRSGNRKATIEKVETFNSETGKKQDTFDADNDIGVRVTFKAHETIDSPMVGFVFQNQQEITVFATNNQIQNQATKKFENKGYLIMESVIENTFTDGEYTIACAIESKNGGTIYDRIEHVHTFAIGGHRLPHATVHPKNTMKIKYNGKK